MSKDPAFLFYPGDYLRDTQCLSESAQVAYDRIMCEHMRKICISKQQLNFFTKRLTNEQKEELLMVLDEKDEGFQIGWVSESILKRRKYSESRRNNRKGSVKEKKNISKSYDSHMENENENEIVDINKDKIKEIVEFLNSESNKNYRYQTVNTQKFIKARLKEKFSVEDFKTVILKKIKEWTGTEWEKYLTPDTLFGKNFEKYLNQTGNFNKNQQFKSASEKQDDLLGEIFPNLGRSNGQTTRMEYKEIRTIPKRDN